MSILKICNFCNKEYELSFFTPDKRTQDGKTNKCYNCNKEHRKLYRNKNKVKNKVRKYTGIKKCCNCFGEKNVSNFYKVLQEKDGLDIYCKICRNTIRKIKRKKTYANNFKMLRENKYPQGFNKKCSKCKLELDISNFSKALYREDGYFGICKSCQSIVDKKRRNKNRDKNLNRGGVDTTIKTKICADCKNELDIEKFATNITTESGYDCYCKKCLNKKAKYKRDTDISYLIKERIKAAFYHSMKKYSLTGKIRELKKYNINLEEIIEHLGTRPNKNSSIDHILPIVCFNHNDDEMIRLCWNYRNLRWISLNENLSKNDKYDKLELKKYILSNSNKYTEKEISNYIENL